MDYESAIIFAQTLIDCEYDIESYSGRGMFGKTCIGVRVSDISDIFNIGINLALHIEDNHRELLEDLDVKFDNMGRGYIVYFPDVPYVNI